MLCFHFSFSYKLPDKGYPKTRVFLQRLIDTGEFDTRFVRLDAPPPGTTPADSPLLILDGGK